MGGVLNCHAHSHVQGSLTRPALVRLLCCMLPHTLRSGYDATFSLGGLEWNVSHQRMRLLVVTERR